jgi:hypothetical protein
VLESIAKFCIQIEEAVFVNRIPGIDARQALFSLPLAGSEASVLALEVDASETSGGVGVFRKVPSDVAFFGNVDAPTRPSLRDGHPPRAFRGGGIKSRSVCLVRIE